MSLNVNAKAWTPPSQSKPAASAPVAIPAQHNNSFNGQQSGSFNPMAAPYNPSFVGSPNGQGFVDPNSNFVPPPYFDPFLGCVVPPLMPQMNVLPNGQLVQIMVPNPYYNPQYAAYSVATAMQPYDQYGNPIGNPVYTTGEEAAPADGAEEPAAEGDVAEITEGVAAVSVETTAAASVPDAAPKEATTTAIPALVPVAPVPALIASPAITKKTEVSVASETKPAPAATVVEKPVSALAAATAKYVQAAQSKALAPLTASKTGKHVYDKTTLISLYKKNTYTASIKIKEVYEKYAAVEREPIGFYFASSNMIPRSGNSSSNLQSHGSSSNLRGNEKAIERGAKVQGGRGGNKHHDDKKGAGFRERLERQERDDELYYGDPSQSPKGDVPAYTSMFKVDENDVEAIARKANFILNKLSVTKFDKLSDEFMAVGLLESSALITRAVDLIVMKAQLEEHFCFMYADLCRKITDCGTTVIAGEESAETAAAAPAADGDDEGAAESKGPKTMGEVFRQLLLERCQSEFEFDRVEALEAIRNNAEATKEEREERELHLKKRYTGTMRFIGELYMKDMIRANVMSGCVENLLSSDVEEELVCLSKLFVTIGARLDGYYNDKAKGSKTKSKKAKYLEVMVGYFTKIADLSENHASSRVRYMLKDLIDMRSNAWVPRREADKVVNLAETRGEQQQQQQQGGIKASVSSNDVRNQNKPAQPAADEWTTVSSVGNKKSSSTANLAQLNTNVAGKAGPASGGKYTAARGGNTGILRSASSSAVSSQSGFSPKGGNSSQQFGDKKKGGIASKDTAPKKSSAPPASEKESAAPAAAKTSVVHGAVFDKDSDCWKKIKSTVEEYYYNKLVEEVVIVLKELQVPATHFPEVIKYLLIGSLEKKAEDRAALSKLIVELTAKENILSASGVTSGLVQFLHEYDDIIIDVPLAGSYAASIVGEVVAANIGVTLAQLFTNLPEENNFTISSRAADFIVQVVSVIATASTQSNAQELLTASKIDLLSLVNAPPRQTKEQALSELATKYNVSLLV